MFRLVGGGAAPLITQEIILCQSLMPHVKFVMLNRRDGLFVRIRFKIEGYASFMKHVGVFIRLVKSNTSHTVCKGWDLSGFTRS